MIARLSRDECIMHHVSTTATDNPMPVALISPDHR
jgi:hypothetical protein